MNNEDKILEMLGTLVERQNKTDEMLNQVIMEQRQLRQEMNERFDAVDERFDSLESSVKFAWEDIDRVEKRIKQHEKEYHEAV